MTTVTGAQAREILERVEAGDTGLIMLTDTLSLSLNKHLNLEFYNRKLSVGFTDDPMRVTFFRFRAWLQRRIDLVESLWRPEDVGKIPY